MKLNYVNAVIVCYNSWVCVSSTLLHFITQKDIVKFTLQVSEIREHGLMQHYIMSHEIMIKCNMHNISVHIYHHIKIPCLKDCQYQ